MPLPRFDKMPSEMKERILEAAAREIAAHGYERASLNRILETAGLSKGAAYYYFEDKADLIATVLRRYWLEFVENPVSELKVDTPDAFWDWLAHLYEHPFDLMESQPWLLGFGKVVWNLPPEVRESGPLGEIWGQAMQWLRLFIQQGQAIGAIRRDLDDDLLLQIITAIDNVHDRWLAGHWEEMNRAEFDRFTRLFADFMRRALEKPFGNAPEASGEG
jgi:AcrR family transcriptional regulator